MKFAVNSSKTVTLSLSARRWHFRQSRPARSPFRIPTVRWSSSSRRRRPRPVSLHSKNIILKIPPTFLWRLCKHSFTVKRESAEEQACAAAMANWGGLGAAGQYGKKITGTKRKRRKILIIPNEMINYSEKPPEYEPAWTDTTIVSFAGVVHHHHHHHIVVVGLVWFGEIFSISQFYMHSRSGCGSCRCSAAADDVVRAPKMPGSNIKFHLHRSNNWDFSTCRSDGALLSHVGFRQNGAKDTVLCSCQCLTFLT